MKDRMANVSRPRRRVVIREAEEGVFIFQFIHAIYVQRILKHRPWLFDKHSLVLSIVPEGIKDIIYHRVS